MHSDSSFFQYVSKLENQVLEICARLQTSYLDVCLLHWPIPIVDGRNRNAEAYAALEQLLREGILRTIGVSNYTRFVL